MNRRVLCVDDEPNVLEALKRTLREHFDISTASSGVDALSLLERGPAFAVLLSDFRMPHMNGVELLAQARRLCPHTVRMLLTGQAEMTDTINAINLGAIFRFLAKPCPSALLVENLMDGVEQYRLVTAERQLLEETLSGVVKLLTDVLSTNSPTVFRRSTRIRQIVHLLLELDPRESQWRFELAAHLALIGCIALPADLVERVLNGQPVSIKERRLFASHPAAGKRLLRAVPRLETVADIVGCQLDRDLSGIRNPIVREGVQLLQAALQADERLAKGEPLPQVLRQVGGVEQLPSSVKLEGYDDRIDEQMRAFSQVTVVDLRPGMFLQEDARALDGQVVVARGQKITALHVERLKSFADSIGIVEPLAVTMQES